MPLFPPSLPVTELVKRTAREVVDDNCLGMAAQLAFYFVLAFFPALIVIVAVASYFPTPLVGGVLTALAPVAPPEIVAIVRRQLEAIAASERGGLLTFGMLATFWSSSGAVLAIIDTLNRAYDIEETRPWWKVRLVGLGLTLGLASFVLCGFALVVAGPELAGYLTTRWGLSRAVEMAWLVLQWPIVFALVSLGISQVYHFAPDVEQRWAWITPGSILATVLWLLVSVGFRFYVTNFSNYNATYGTLAGGMILLLWLYLSGLSILIGGELNSEIHHASRGATGSRPDTRRGGAIRSATPDPGNTRTPDHRP
jgi:membrane protein